MFVLDLLLLALCPMIFPDPGMQRVFIHAQVPRGLRNRLLRLDRQFDCTLLKCGRILSRRGLTHRTHLVCCESSLAPCVRKSIATSLARQARSICSASCRAARLPSTRKARATTSASSLVGSSSMRLFQRVRVPYLSKACRY